MNTGFCLVSRCPGRQNHDASDPRVSTAVATRNVLGSTRHHVCGHCQVQLGSKRSPRPLKEHKSPTDTVTLSLTQSGKSVEQRAKSQRRGKHAQLLLRSSVTAFVPRACGLWLPWLPLFPTSRSSGRATGSLWRSSVQSVG